MGFNGIDVDSIVSYLIQAEGAKLNKLSQSKDATKLKSDQFGQINSYVLNLKKNIDNMKAAFKTVAYTTSVADSSALSVKITNNTNVYPSTHEVIVTQLAKADIWRSAGTFASRDGALSLSGDLTFTSDGHDFSIAISATDTLDIIRDKINNSTDNIGVTASIVSSTSGGNSVYSLVVSGSKTGADNAVAISGSAAPSLSLTDHFATAQSAEFTFDGQSVVRNSNDVTDVMDGVSFNLLKEGATNFTISSSVSDRNSAVTKAMQDMLTSYNQLINYIGSTMAPHKVTEKVPVPPNLAKPDTTEKTRDRWVTGKDDSMISIRDRLVNLFNQQFSGAAEDITSLLEMGIKTSTPIKVTVAEKTATSEKIEYVVINQKEINSKEFNGETIFNRLLTGSPEKIEEFFTKAGGFIEEADKLLNSITEGAGTVFTKQQFLGEQINSLTLAMRLEEDRLEKLKPVLIRKYTSLATLMEQFNSLSSQLEMQFSSMSTMGKK